MSNGEVEERVCIIVSGHRASAEDDQSYTSKDTTLEYTLVMLRSLFQYTACLIAQKYGNVSTLVISKVAFQHAGSPSESVVVSEQLC
jgi:hypothetical protein